MLSESIDRDKILKERYAEKVAIIRYIQSQDKLVNKKSRH